MVVAAAVVGEEAAVLVGVVVAKGEMIVMARVGVATEVGT